jgi:hypothetical protein
LDNFEVDSNFGQTGGVPYNHYSKMSYGVNFLAKDKSKRTLWPKTAEEVCSSNALYLNVAALDTASPPSGYRSVLFCNIAWLNMSQQGT